MNETIKVKISELRVGDFIEACELADGSSRHVWTNNEEVISEPVSRIPGFWIFDTRATNGEVRKREKAEGLVFTVRRGGKTTVTKVKDLSGRFPHTCPHCAGPAYVGLSTFECERGCR